MIFTDDVVAARIKLLERDIADLKRKNLELTRVYAERGLQIDRLELGLKRAKELHED